MERQVAVVTGGLGGIGSAIARRLAAEYQTIACYFRHANHDEAREWQIVQKTAGFDIEIMYPVTIAGEDCLANHSNDNYFAKSQKCS